MRKELDEMDAEIGNKMAQERLGNIKPHSQEEKQFTDLKVRFANLTGNKHTHTHPTSQSLNNQTSQSSIINHPTDNPGTLVSPIAGTIAPFTKCTTCTTKLSF